MHDEQTPSEFEMNLYRSKLIESIRKCSPAAYPTELTFDVGLQFDIVTKDGIGRVLGSIGDWVCHAFEKPDSKQWYSIIRRIKEEKLTIDDVKNTTLGRFYSSLLKKRIDNKFEDEMCSFQDFFAGLEDIDDVQDERFVYANCDPGMITFLAPTWFATKNDMMNDMIAEYEYSIDPFEIYSVEELEEVQENCEEHGFVCCEHLVSDADDRY